CGLPQTKAERSLFDFDFDFDFGFDSDSNKQERIWARISPIERLALSPFRCKQLKFLESSWPVFAKQSRKSPVGKEPAAGLASGAIFRLIGSVANALNSGFTTRAGLLVASMNRHAFAKCGHLLWEFPGSFST